VSSTASSVSYIFWFTTSFASYASDANTLPTASSAGYASIADASPTASSTGYASVADASPIASFFVGYITCDADVSCIASFIGYIACVADASRPASSICYIVCAAAIGIFTTYIISADDCSRPGSSALGVHLHVFTCLLCSWDCRPLVRDIRFLSLVPRRTIYPHFAMFFPVCSMVFRFLFLDSNIHV
jgi:hypothetical protein